MTRDVIIVLVLLATIQSAVQLQCNPGEEEDMCPSNCFTDNCPTKERDYSHCTSVGECGDPRCKCQFNTKRALNGTCIDTRECPPFKCDRENEEYVACPPLCPADDCKQSTPDGRCPIFTNMLIVLECAPACRCIRGYWRENGHCVPYDECSEHATTLPILFG